MALGISQQGLAGALAAWLGFTMPSALLLIGFAYGFTMLGFSADAGWLHASKSLPSRGGSGRLGDGQDTLP